MHNKLNVMGWSRFSLARLTFVRSLASFWNSLAQRLAWPYVELLIRLWIAKLFFFFGVQELMHWTAAVRIADEQNPFPMLAPIVSAYLSTGADLICAILLAVGFMTRYASLPLLILAAITQFRFEPFDTQLFWIALFGWYVIHGAGPISLDHLLRRGLADSAIPLIPGAIRFSRWLRSTGTPWYLMTLRLWLAAALIVAASADARLLLGTSGERGLPLDVATRVPMFGALIGGITLTIGAGTRQVALLLLLGLFTYSVVDPRLSDSIYLLMLLAILAIHGGGALAIDDLAKRWQSRLFPTPSANELASRKWPRVVIVGAGFGGLRCAQALKDARVAVTLIDRNNFHLFQPLLYQIATAALSPGDIAVPTRQIFRDAPATKLLLSTVTGIDTEKRLVLTERREIPYDYLVLATGATHSYFGKDEWARHAPGLKYVEDALDVRRRILTAFERAEESIDPLEKALLTFLIVGGGPTGVELAGAIAELARFGLNQDFRTFDPANARIILVQAGQRLLPSFPERLSRIAQRELEILGVQVRLESRVNHIDERGVGVDGERIEARTILWAAGVAASPASMWLKTPSDRAGRIVVGEDLRVPGMSNVFAVGDTVASNAWNGQPVPGLAPAAKQGGEYVAKQIRALIDGRVPLPAFRYRHLGSLATIGRKAAVADFGAFKLWGAPAWWLWGIVHIGFMLGVRNRVATLLNWFWSYLKFGGGIRLITGDKA